MLRIGIGFTLVDGGAPLGDPGPVPVNVVAPEIADPIVVDAIVACSTGTWSNAPTSYTYQWTRDGDNITGETGYSYTVVEADAGTVLNCLVTAHNAFGASAPEPSNGVTVDAGGLALDKPAGTRIKGANLSCRPIDYQPLGDRDQSHFGNLWGATDSNGAPGGSWDLSALTDQVDLAIDLGCNSVRIMGAIMQRVGGTLDNTDYADRVRSFLDYCRSKHMLVHFCIFAASELRDQRVSLPDRPIIPTVDILAHAELDAAVLAEYADIIWAIDPLQEVFALTFGYEAGGACSQSAITAEERDDLIQAMYSTLRPLLPESMLICCSGMQQGFEYDEDIFSTFTLLTNNAGYYDFIDFHLYCDSVSSAQIDVLQAAFPAMQLYIGETGAPLDNSRGMTPDEFAVAFHDSYSLGGAVWALIDFTDATPGDQWGTHDDTGTIRTKGVDFRRLTSGFDSASAWNGGYVDTFSQVFTSAPNDAPPISLTGWTDANNVWELAGGYLTADTSGDYPLLFTHVATKTYLTGISTRVSATRDTNTILILGVGFVSTTVRYSCVVNITTGNYNMYVEHPDISGGFVEISAGNLHTPTPGTAYDYQMLRWVNGTTSTLQIAVYALDGSNIGYAQIDDNRAGTSATTGIKCFITTNQFVNSSARLKLTRVVVTEQAYPEFSAIHIPASRGYIGLTPTQPLGGSWAGISVTKNGSPWPLASMIPRGGELRLYSDTAISGGDTILVSYDADIGNLANLSSKTLPSFTNVPATFD